MEVIYLQVFVTFGLVLGSLLLFAFSTRQRDVDHADRLALFPIEDEAVAPLEKRDPPRADPHEKNEGKAS